jgi:hypothetical protein
MMQHELAPWVQWHGRLMVLAWVILLPLGVLIARFFKITPRQAWPAALDNKFWWHCHRWLQYGGIALMTAAAVLAILHANLANSPAPVHGVIGFVVIGLGWLQIVGGWLRGSKGGPKGGPGGTATAEVRGDHYDMTPRRIVFEYLHKVGGYLVIGLATVDVVLGLRAAHALAWITGLIVAAWLGGIATFVWLQRTGHCIDTYQAIWGPDLEHPGNRIPPIGWGIRRRHAVKPTPDSIEGH